MSARDFSFCERTFPSSIFLSLYWFFFFTLRLLVLLLSPFKVLWTFLKATWTRLAWKIPWTEEPGRLQSLGSQRVGHEFTFTFTLTLVLHILGRILALGSETCEALYTQYVNCWKWLTWERLYFSTNSNSSFTFMLSSQKSFIKINLVHHFMSNLIMTFLYD